jgi:putative transposase
VIIWSLSNTMDAIFNIDQGSQFTTEAFTSVLKKNHIQISMDGKGRATDNIFDERLWRSLKYENVYLNPAQDGVVLYEGISWYINFYNTTRVLQHLDYRVPIEVFKAAA